jgi:hypothetical protein
MSPCFQTPPGDPYYADVSGVTYATEQDCNDHCSELGACCRGNLCSQETRCQCEQNNEGAFQGIGVPCSAAPCPCVIKPIDSIEVTITAQDVSFEGQCIWDVTLDTNCGPLRLADKKGHSSFFPGASYAGTYSLTKLSGGAWTYTWSASGQVCGGSIVAVIGRGTIEIEVLLYGILSVNFGSSTPRPSSQLTCQRLDPQVRSDCVLVQPYKQDHQCFVRVFASLPCRDNEVSMAALPLCASPISSCNGVCGIQFGEICISSVSIDYA